MKITGTLIGTIVIAALATGCHRQNSMDQNTTPTATNSSTLQNAKEGMTNAWEKTKEATTNVVAGMKEAFQSATDYTYDQKDAFTAKASADMDALDQTIKEFSDKAAGASDSIKADAQTKIQELREKRDALAKKRDDVKNSTEANWQEAKASFQQGYDDVKASCRAAWQWLADKMS